MRWVNLIFGGFALLTAISTSVQAQSFPAKSIVFVVPYPAGGGVDLTGRLLAGKMSQQLARSIVIENRAGAGGTIGAEYVAKAAADGYTYLIGGTGPLSVAPALYKNLPYNPIRDFAPVMLVVRIPQILVVHASLPVRSLSELLALIRKHPGQFNAASGGTGTGQHLSAALMATMAKVQITHVPYKGTAPAVSDLLGGHVEMYFGDPSILPLVKSGRLRALGVTTKDRYPALPDVQSIGEVLKGFELISFYAMSAPAGTPREIVQRMNAEANKALVDPETRQKFESNGLLPAGGTPEYLGDLIRTHSAVSAKVLREANATKD